MGSGNSGLYSGAYGGSTTAETKKDTSAKQKTFQGNRSRKEYSDLARDPARGTKVDYKGQKERSIALDLERQGKLGYVTRDNQADKGADFIDKKTGQKWDVKSPVSHPKGHTSARKGAFNVNKMMSNVQKEIARGNKVILDTRRLTKQHRKDFKEAIHNAGLDKQIIWYDKKGPKA